MNYRGDIDGLRAISVLSVIFYHAFGKTIFPGGFIGVDIFFVISGYLITRIILNSLFESNSFDIFEFYERRARRILPMLFFVILVSIPFSWILLMPEYLVDYSKSVISSILFVSNYFFYFSTTEYGAESSLLKPFLHTWSLGIEEQFYLIFPIFITILYNFRKNILIFILVFFFLSLFFAEIMSSRNEELNFYLPMSRFWELGTGSILAYIELKYGSVKTKLLIVNNILSILGLSLVFYSIFHFNTYSHHPGLMTLIPVFGAALIITFSTPYCLVGKVLGSKPLIWIGLISYSAYLWHFPIFSFARWSTITESRIGKADLDNIDKLILIVLVLAISTLTFHIIERPFRNSISKEYFLKIMLIMFVLLMSVSFIGVYYNGFPNRIPAFLIKENFDDRVKYKKDYARCHNKKDFNFCTFGDKDKDIYLIGDSHMGALAFELRNKAKRYGYNLTLMTGSGALYGKKKEIDKARLDVLENINNSVVVLGGFSHREKEIFFKENHSSYSNLLNMLVSNNNIVIIIYPIPSVSLDYSMMLVSEYNIFKKLKNRSISLSDHYKVEKKAVEFYDKFKNELIFRVYPSKYSCENMRCYAVKNNIIYISDYDHPSKYLSSIISDEIIKIITYK